MPSQPHESSVSHTCGVTVAVDERHQSLDRISYTSYEPPCIPASIRTGVAAATTLEHIELRRRLTRHGYLADGNELPPRNAGGHALPFAACLPRAAKHYSQMYRKGISSPWSHTWTSKIATAAGRLQFNSIAACPPLMSRPDAFLWLSVRSNVT